MKTFNYFTVLAILTLTASCNEKISPKLLDANQSTTVPPVIEPEVYSFKVTNTSPETRKFHLHKTGPGNFEKPCEIKSTSKFSSVLYRDPGEKPNFDITCFFEAEELALANRGFSFKFEATPNTCEYVGYAPFSFYNFKPGNSSANYTAIICEDGVSDGNVQTSAQNNLRPLTAEGTQVRCNQMVLNESGPDGIASTDALPTVIPDEEALCRYNYSNNASYPGPNCDIGTINIHEITYTLVPPENEGDPATIIGKPATKPRVIKCGGKIEACVSGPILTEENRTDETWLVNIHETEKNKPFEAKREYEKVNSKFGTKYYANFRRNLANPHIDYVSQPDEENAAYITYARSYENFNEFNSLVMENYAAGLNYAANDDMLGLDWNDHQMREYNGNSYPVFKGVSYAADPFMGKERVNPFYTFYCLDSAREIRARIKMVVRDWDRFFPSDRTQFDLISDIFNFGNARMDNPFGIEFPGDGDVLNDLNDHGDWDDFVRMTRTPGAINPTSTVWQPVEGFHSPLIFPGVIGD